MEQVFEHVFERVKELYPETCLQMGNVDENVKVIMHNAENNWKIYLDFDAISKTVSCTCAYTYGGVYDLHFLSKLQKTTVSILTSWIKKTTITCLIAREEPYYFQPQTLFAHGAAAEEVLHLLLLLQQNYKVILSVKGGQLAGDYTRYQIEYDFDEPALHIYKNQVEVAVLRTEADMEEFSLRQKKVASELLEIENRLVSFAQQLDASAYYKRRSKSGSFLYMLGGKISFSVTEIGGPRQLKYKAKFYNGFTVSDKVDALEEKIKKKMEHYYKKNRLKVVTKKTTTLFERHLYEMTGKRITEYAFKKQVNSSLPFETIVDVIGSAATLEMGTSTDERWFQTYIQNQRMRHQLKKSFRLGTLRLYLTGSKWFIFEESELNSTKKKKA